MKATEQHFHLLMFIMLYKLVLTFKSVDETLVCDHSYKQKNDSNDVINVNVLKTVFMLQCVNY